MVVLKFAFCMFSSLVHPALRSPAPAVIKRILILQSQINVPVTGQQGHPIVVSSIRVKRKRGTYKKKEGSSPSRVTSLGRRPGLLALHPVLPTPIPYEHLPPRCPPLAQAHLISMQLSHSSSHQAPSEFSRQACVGMPSLHEHCANDQTSGSSRHARVSDKRPAGTGSRQALTLILTLERSRPMRPVFQPRAVNFNMAAAYLLEQASVIGWAFLAYLQRLCCCSEQSVDTGLETCDEGLRLRRTSVRLTRARELPQPRSCDRRPCRCLPHKSLDLSPAFVE